MSRKSWYKVKPFVVGASPLTFSVKEYMGREHWRHPFPSAAFMAADPCVYCGREAVTWDHIQAVSKGGRNTAANVARACTKCNKEKETMTVLHFLSWRANGSVHTGILRQRRKARRAERRAALAAGINPAIRDLHRGILKHLARLLAARTVLENAD